VILTKQAPAAERFKREPGHRKVISKVLQESVPAIDGGLLAIRAGF
jgi:hypothetical protein